MARRPSKHTRPARPLSTGHGYAAVKADGRFLVRTVAGATAAKQYRCPGCQQVIAVGTPHLVVWPDVPTLLARSGLEERRHWHTACWQRRA